MRNQEYRAPAIRRYNKAGITLNGHRRRTLAQLRTVAMLVPAAFGPSAAAVRCFGSGGEGMLETLYIFLRGASPIADEWYEEQQPACDPADFDGPFDGSSTDLDTYKREEILMRMNRAELREHIFEPRHEDYGFTDHFCAYLPAFL